MKIYIAASFSLKDEVRSLYELFQSHGHTITKDWTEHEGTHPDERDEKAELVSRYAMEDIEGVRDADVFIMLTGGPGGTGRYIELGTAVHSHLEKDKPHVYVVGDSTAESVFYYHPSVKRRAAIEDVLQEINDLEW